MILHSLYFRWCFKKLFIKNSCESLPFIFFLGLKTPVSIDTYLVSTIFQLMPNRFRISLFKHFSRISLHYMHIESIILDCWTFVINKIFPFFISYLIFLQRDFFKWNRIESLKKKKECSELKSQDNLLGFKLMSLWDVCVYFDENVCNKSSHFTYVASFILTETIISLAHHS